MDAHPRYFFENRRKIQTFECKTVKTGTFFILLVQFDNVFFNFLSQIFVQQFQAITLHKIISRKILSGQNNSLLQCLDLHRHRFSNRRGLCNSNHKCFDGQLLASAQLNISPNLRFTIYPILACLKVLITYGHWQTVRS